MKRIIGYTTGVFDLFHIGHLNILKRAKMECDELIVGITTDELCMKLKNKIPVIPFAERSSIVEAIRVVDLVVPQEHIDELGDLERYGFHKIFKGSDWAGTPKWTALENAFAKKGVSVIYFDYTTSTSSTLVRNALEQKAS